MAKKKTKKDQTPSPMITKSYSLAVLRPCSFRPSSRRDGGERDISWEELVDRLQIVWRAAGRLMNRTISWLAAHDKLPLATDTKMPTMPKSDIYKHMLKEGGLQAEKDAGVWVGEKASAGVLINRAEKAYTAARFEVYLTGRIALRSYRKRDYAYPVRCDRWHAKRDKENGDVFISYPLPAIDVSGSVTWLDARYKERYPHGLPAGMVTLQVKSGKEWGRQIAVLSSIIDGVAKQQELNIYQQDAPKGGGHDARAPGGHQRKPSRIMIRFVATSRGPAPRPAHAVLIVRTCATSFLVTEVEGRSPSAYQKWTSNGRHIGRGEGGVPAARMAKYIADHLDYLWEISLDKKPERSLPRHQKVYIGDNMDRRCCQQLARIKTWMYQEIASLRRYCRRHHVARVIYEDKERGYFRSFPWAVFRERLGAKLAEDGIRFLATCQEPDEEDGIRSDECRPTISEAEAEATETVRITRAPRSTAMPATSPRR